MSIRILTRLAYSMPPGLWLHINPYQGQLHHIIMEESREMAKRGIEDHPKTLKLAAVLKLDPPFIVGLLEVFWHWVAKFHPTGDVTDTDMDILAQSMRYTGNPGLFWQGMLDCGFLVRKPLLHRKGRICVHDWSHHADDSVQKYLQYHGLVFWDGVKPFSGSKLQARSVRAPKSHAKTDDTNSREKTVLGDIAYSLLPIAIANAEEKKTYFERWYEHYPNKTGRGHAEKAFEKLNPDEELVKQMILAVENQIAARAQKRAAGQWVPEWKNPATWINGKCWLDVIDVSVEPSSDGRKGPRQFDNSDEKWEQVAKDVVAKGGHAYDNRDKK